MMAGLALAISLGAGPAAGVSPASEASGQPAGHGGASAGRTKARPVPAGAGSASAVPARSHDHAHGHHHDHHDDAASLAARQALLVQAQARLARGDAAGALRAFEQAAQSAHQAEIELGILRAQMQLGDYRHALAFAAHTAGVHLDEVEGRVFYAWLLNLGAQGPMAELTLRQAEATAPQHPLVQAVRQRWQAGDGKLAAAMLQGPARLAPCAWGEAVPEQAKVVASGTLLADGRHALVPVAVATSSAPIWLRNGLGQTVAAHVVDQDDALGLALLRGEQPLPVIGDERLLPRDAFAGSPLYALDQAVDDLVAPVAGAGAGAGPAPATQPAVPGGQPAWPLMRAGFLGRDTLGVDWPATATTTLRGGPALDAGGRLSGVVRRTQLKGQLVDSLVPVRALRERFGDHFGPTDPAVRPTPAGADTAYERGLRLTLQVLRSAP